MIVVSTTEVEYIAILEAMKEAFKKFFIELGVVPSIIDQ